MFVIPEELKQTESYNQGLIKVNGQYTNREQ
jgi:hypothetical protein